MVGEAESQSSTSIENEAGGIWNNIEDSGDRRSLRGQEGRAELICQVGSEVIIFESPQLYGAPAP